MGNLTARREYAQRTPFFSLEYYERRNGRTQVPYKTESIWKWLVRDGDTKLVVLRLRGEDHCWT